MAKTKKTKSSGRGEAGRPTSLLAVRATRAVDAVTADFVRWFEDGFGPAEEALACLNVVAGFVTAYLAKTGTLTATGFTPEPVGELLEELDEEADGDESAYVMVEMLHVYVDFLHETDRWSASEDDYARVHALLTDGPGIAEGGPWALAAPEIHVPALSEAEQAEAFAALPLIHQARALLEWIGTGRPVTQTGGLRLADLEAAAACVGVKAKGVRKRTQEALEAAGDGGYVLAQSMWDLQPLARMWAALAAGLIEIRSTKVVLRPDADEFLNGTAAVRVELSRELVTDYLYNVVHPEDDAATEWEAGVAAMELGILATAASAQPPQLEKIRALAGSVPGVDELMSRYAVHGAMADLLSLADLGLLEFGERITVPPVVVQSVAEAFEAEYGLTVEYAESVRGARARGAAGATQPLLQLKVMLKGSKPPIWRRVLISSGTRLDGLHRVIQAAFGWGGYHLHEFRQGGWDGTHYGPKGGDWDDTFGGTMGEELVDESAVRVSDLLAAKGDKLTYVYDFGDNWQHEVTLEAVLEHDGGPSPRVVTGRGRGPAEDCGGSWGWAEVVQAVNDPAHERHEELREWMGLKPGETLDPKAFDVNEVNRSLEPLRR